MAGSITEAPTRTGLALERTRIACERTLMAWIRTAVSLIGFGFSIPHFFRYLQEAGGLAVPRRDEPFTLGLMLIALGIGSLLAGTLEQVRLLKRISSEPVFGQGRWVSFATALCLAAFGVYAFADILSRS